MTRKRAPQLLPKGWDGVVTESLVAEWALDYMEQMTDRSGGPDACWLWNGRRMHTGYGVVTAGLTFVASRVAWVAANGQPVPPGMLICHACDNPPCVNPAHLWVGTQEDNIADARRKGRLGKGPKGEPLPCGTPAAYQRHRRHNQPACRACTDAYNAEQRRRYAARKGTR